MIVFSALFWRFRAIVLAAAGVQVVLDLLDRAGAPPGETTDPEQMTIASLK